MPATKQQPFDLKASQLKGFDSLKDLAVWLTEELQNAEDTRTHLDTDLDYWHRIYEQNRTRLTTNRPKPDGADLTSPLGTQYVDSLHARIMKTVFGVEPICVVEGWGDSAQRAPFVEEFHQWAAEDERVQSYVDRATLNSLIDAEGVLEVYEEIDYRPVRKRIWAQIETIPDEFGQPRAVFDERNQPKLVRDERGNFLEVPPPAEGQPAPMGAAEVDIDSYEPVRIGPGYTVIDIRDFLVLPSHARDKRDVWGYAKRFYRRHSYLEQKAKDGIYDAEALKAIGTENEREQTLDDTRRNVTIGRLEGQTAEKELHEVAFLRNLDGKGERWWVATVHVPTRTLLRLKYDDLGTQIGFGRFVRFVPLPRKNSISGLSVIGHKLITEIEEHTAVRNMRADLAALMVATAGTMKVRQNALYDPEEQPLGVGSAIYVRDHDEVTQLDVPQMPPLLTEWERTILDGAERTMGVNEIASGIQPQSDRTLGEVQMTAGYSEVRMDLIVKRIQETIEELWQIRHVIWKRVIASQGQVPLPMSIMWGLESRGVEIAGLDQAITPDLFDGKYKFKPRGSVETADNGRLRSDFVQAMQMLPALMQVNPMIAAMLQTPNAARAFLEQWVKLFKFPDRQAILGMPGQMAGQTQQLLAAPEIQQLLMQGGQMPPGGPPMGGPPMPPQEPPMAMPGVM